MQSTVMLNLLIVKAALGREEGFQWREREEFKELRTIHQLHVIYAGRFTLYSEYNKCWTNIWDQILEKVTQTF